MLLGDIRFVVNVAVRVWWVAESVLIPAMNISIPAQRVLVPVLRVSG
jgi:hypothetical protein